MASKKYLSFLGSSLARSTWKRYNSAVGNWKIFAKINGLDWKNFDHDLTSEFIIWCGRAKGLKSKTVKAYLGILKTLTKLRWELRKGRGKVVEKFLLKGIDNSGGKNKEKRAKRVSPVDLEILATVKRGLKRLKIKRVSRISVWATCLIAFWGAFRLAEILPKNTANFDKFSDLLWADVNRSEGQGKITFKIKSAKFPGPPGNRAEIFEIGRSFFCPVAAFNSAETSQKIVGLWDKNLPVFRRSSGKNLNRATFLKTINKALRAAGVKNKRLGGKSFRSGMLSALKNFPPHFQEKHLKLLGRWRGDSYQFNMWNGPVHFRQAYGSVANSLIRDFEHRRCSETQVVPLEGAQQRQRGRRGE
jgi:hypothetical protein